MPILRLVVFFIFVTSIVSANPTNVASAQTNSTTSNENQHSVLVEAESFSDHGGWKLDTQFIDEMGSPYLLAHGLGRPVKKTHRLKSCFQPSENTEFLSEPKIGWLDGMRKGRQGAFN